MRKLVSVLAVPALLLACAVQTSSTWYYIRNGYIYGPQHSGDFYIRNGYIYGPKNGGQYYIRDDYIYGPRMSGEFYIRNGYIYGPTEELPWHQD